MSPSRLENPVQNSVAGVMVAVTGAALLAAPPVQARTVPASRGQDRWVIADYQYLLKHEDVPPNPDEQEVLVEMTATKVVKLRFKKPKPLEFQPIEDADGFVR